MGARRLMGRAAARSAPLGAAAALLLLSAVVPASADSATCTDTPTGSTQCTLAAYLTGQGQVRAYALQHRGTIEARRAVREGRRRQRDNGKRLSWPGAYRRCPRPKRTPRGIAQGSCLGVVCVGAC